MKTLLAGIVLIVVLGVGSLIYRNAIEHPSQPVACPVDAKTCPDGSSVGRVGSTCEFQTCPPPNLSLAEADIAFALPAGYVADENAPGAEPSLLAAFVTPDATNPSATITIRRYTIEASSTALATIQATAIGGTSGVPVSATAFTSTTIGTHRFTVVSIERFEGVVDTAYYLARGQDVLRFDAIDQGVALWTNPGLDTSSLPGAAALKSLLASLQGAS